jgi:hypothetical protein
MKKQSTGRKGEGADAGKSAAKRPYKRPVLTKLGSLKDLTMNTSGGVTRDGPPSRHTGRGGRKGVDAR